MDDQFSSSFLDDSIFWDASRSRPCSNSVWQPTDTLRDNTFLEAHWGESKTPVEVWSKMSAFWMDKRASLRAFLLGLVGEYLLRTYAILRGEPRVNSGFSVRSYHFVCPAERVFLGVWSSAARLVHCFLSAVSVHVAVVPGKYSPRVE